jgi:succinyl-CoA synthetase beta subunit
MRLLEHESKEILGRYNILLPKGELIGSARELKMDSRVMLKAQIPLGGRGKSGGVIEASSIKEAKDKIEQLLSTPIRGYMARKILVEQKIDIAQEFFMSITYDTVAKEPLVIFSPEGGVDIEGLATTQPEKIQKAWFTVRGRLPEYRAREILSEAGISGRMLLGLGAILSSLADIFLDVDATVAEMNPLALSRDGKLVALDCHLEIDDDALYRHRDLARRVAHGERYEGGRKSTDFERKAAEIDTWIIEALQAG